MNKLRNLLIGTVIVILLTFSLCGSLSLSQSSANDNYLIKEFNIDNVKKHIKYLSSLGSRVTGYPGYYKAVRYIEEVLKSYGLKVWNQTFYATVPIEEYASMKVIHNGKIYKFNVHMVYPNYLIVPEIVNNLTGKLVYVGSGSLSEFKNVTGCIVVMDFLSGRNWLNVFKLGGKAVIFVNPMGEMDRLEAMEKFVMAPISFPRFMVIDANQSRQLIKLAMKGAYATLSGCIKLEKVKAYNIIAEIKGTEYPNNTIILGAHFDTICITPAYAPGAEDAVSMAFLLELARILSIHKPKYTIWIVAFSAHWQALKGPREFVEKYFFEEGIKPLLTITYEITSGSTKIVPSISGFFYGQWHGNIIARHSVLISLIQSLRDKFKKEYPKLWSEIKSVEYDSGSIYTESYGFSGYALPLILDSEPMRLAGSLGLTFVTFKDLRLKMLTPIDTYDNLNFKNLYSQFIHVLFITEGILEAKPKDISSTIYTPVRVQPMGYGGFGFAKLEVEVVRYDPRVPTLYSPIPHSVVSIYKVSGWWSKPEAANQYNAFARIVELTDSYGKVIIDGIPASVAAAGDLYILAFKFDSKSGKITYAPDEGPHGAGAFPHKIEVKYAFTKARTVVFKCSSIVLTDLAIPNMPRALITFDFHYTPSFPIPFTTYECPTPIEIKVIKALSYSEPEFYGGLADPASRIAVAFVPPHERVQVIVLMSGLKKKTILLLNSTKNNPYGEGYYIAQPGEQIVIRSALKAYTTAMLWISECRYSRAARFGVKDPLLEKYMTDCEADLNRAINAMNHENYAIAHAWLLRAWSYALKAYERTRVVVTDATNSVIPLLILLIPFVLLFESLTVGAKGKKKVISMIIIGLIFFGLLELLNPGFHIVSSVPALIIGVILIVLIAPTLFFLGTELSYAVSEIRKRTFGLHFLERERVGLMISSITISIQNMRKRPLRTFLTCVAVILLVALLISLTSVLPLAVTRPMPYKLPIPLTGIMIRSPQYEPLSQQFVEDLKNLYKDWIISERYWGYLGENGEYLSSEHGSCLIKAIIGLSPYEGKITFKNVAITGRWFTKYDKYACILTSQVAKSLRVTVGDTIELLGMKLTVVGIIDQSTLENYIDIDDKSILPLDAEALNMRRVFDMSLRLSWSDVIIIPSQLAKLLPGMFICSLVMYKSNVNATYLNKVASDIFNHFETLAVYSCYKGKGIILSKAYTFSVFGMEFMIIPIILVSLILVTTLLGSIHERLREASIYSALGLSPTLVATMFLTEGVVYAVIGEIIGYILGATMANILRLYGGAEYIGINYSSSAVSMVIGLTFAVIIAASGYPFIKIARLVTPSLERKWKPKTKPKGDIWEVPLPFVFTSEREVFGLIAYLKEFMEARRYERMGSFTTLEEVNIESVPDERYSVITTVRLAPFELNLNQNVVITFLKSKTERKIFTVLTVKRLSGPYNSWLTSNLRFIDEIRKQLLTWRLLKPEEREKYISTGVKVVGE